MDERKKKLSSISSNVSKNNDLHSKKKRSSMNNMPEKADDN